MSAILQVEATIDLIHDIDSARLPQPSARRIVRDSIAKLNGHLHALRASTGRPLYYDEAASALSSISDILLVLGLLENSSNVRNGFETYSAISELTRKIVGDDALLLLSFQWDWEPYVHIDITAFPHVVGISLPASEAKNPLVLALVGHELGHWLWEKVDKLALTQEITARLRKLLSTPDAPAEVASKSEVHQLTMRQLEEIFCDSVMVYIFGPSSLRAFHYFLQSPMSVAPVREYPSYRDRAGYLCDALDKTKFRGHDRKRFSLEFPEQSDPPASDSEWNAIVKVRRDLASDIIATAFAECEARELDMPGVEAVNAVAQALSSKMPASNGQTLGELVCGAWLAFDGSNSGTRTEVAKLNELVLKSVEISELYRRGVLHAET